MNLVQEKNLFSAQNSLGLNKLSQHSVEIIVVTYNSSAYLPRFLESLEQLDYQNFSLTIVDNASSNIERGLLFSLQEIFPFRLIFNTGNGGFATGNNLGIKHALSRNIDFIWLLNADMIVEPDSLSALIEMNLSCPDISCWGSSVWMGEPGENPAVWSEGGFWNLQSREVYMERSGEPVQMTREKTSAINCDYVPGCSMFFRPALVKKVGFMPEEFFMYFEETAWCKSMADLGLKRAICPNSIVWHLFDSSKVSSSAHTYYYNRSYYNFWYRCSSELGKLKLVGQVLFRKLPEAIRAHWYCRDKMQKKVFAAHIRACADFLLGRQAKV